MKGDMRITAFVAGQQQQQQNGNTASGFPERTEIILES
jgi:hypothetical protein